MPCGGLLLKMRLMRLCSALRYTCKKACLGQSQYDATSVSPSSHTGAAPPGSTYCLGVDGVLNLPLHQPRVDPEGVDAQRDDAQEQPLNPQPKDAPTGADELKLPAMEIRVLGPSPFDQDDGERVADPKCADRYQDAKDLGTEPGCGPTAELVNLSPGNGPGASRHYRARPRDGCLPIRQNMLVVDAQEIPPI